MSGLYPRTRFILVKYEHLKPKKITFWYKVVKILPRGTSPNFSALKITSYSNKVVLEKLCLKTSNDKVKATASREFLTPYIFC